MSDEDRAGRPAERGLGGDVASPFGQLMTLADLPPPGTKRWVIRRKAEVVAGVRLGLISLEEACRRYNLSLDEFLSWQRSIDRYGVRGLRATRIQDYRAERQDARPPPGTAAGSD